MKKIAFALLTIFSLFVISCEIGLGASVDTDPPSLTISNPPVDSIIRDDFAISGTWTDDGSIGSISVELSRTDGNGEKLSFSGTFAEDSRKGGSGTWSAGIPAKSTSITDGTYQAVVTIKDSTGRTTIQNTTFTIDNTAPVLIMQRPATDISTTDESAIDTYGKILSLEGRAADDNNIDHIDVKIYSDAAKTTLLDTITLKNVPLSIALDAAKWGDDAYNKIYGTTVEDRKQRWCTIEAYDSAQRYPADGSEQSNADKNGNCATEYYLYNEIANSSLADLKVTELYAALNGTNSRSAIDSNAVKTTLNQLKKTTGTFFLNPQNNPTFKLAGYNSAEVFTTYENSSITIDVEPGLDGIPVKKNSLKVFFIKAASDGTPETGAEKIYPDDVTIQGASSYKISIKIDRKKAKKADGTAVTYTYGDYLVGVEGEDTKDNPLIGESLSLDKLGYPITISTAGEAPELEVNYNVNGVDTTDGIIYLPKNKIGTNLESELILSGTVKVTTEETPNFQIKVDNEVLKRDGVEIDKTVLSAPDENGIYAFNNITITKTDFKDNTKSGQHSIVVIANNGAETTVRTTIMYDIEGPVVEIRNVTPIAYAYNENSTVEKTTESGTGSQVEKKYINGNISVSVSFTDAFDVVDTDENSTRKPKIEFIQLDSDDNEISSVIEENITNLSVTKDNVITTGLNSGTNDEGKEVIIRVTAYDRAGNRSVKEEKLTVRQDTDKPYIVLENTNSATTRTLNNLFSDISSDDANRKNVFTANSQLRLKLIDDDGLASYKLYITKAENENPTKPAGKFVPIDSAPKEYILSEELPDVPGYYKVWVEATDINTPGKTRSINPFFLQIAAAAPVVTVENPTYVTTNTVAAELDTPVDKLPVTISIESTEAPFTITYADATNSDPDTGTTTIAGSALTTVSSGSSSVVYTYDYVPAQAPTGTYKTKFFVKDKNNRSSARTITYKVDNEKPVTTITSTAPTVYASTNTFKGSVTEDYSGVKEVQVSFKADHSDILTANGSKEWYYDATFDAGTTENPGLNLSEGLNTFYVRTIDNVGNIGGWQNQSFVYDKEAPQVDIKIDDVPLTTTLTQVKTSEYTFKYKVTETYDLKEGTSGESISLKRNDEAFTNFDVSEADSEGWKTVTIKRANANDSIDGTYTYTISATDLANKNTVIERTIKLDTAAPIITITTPDFDSYQNTSTINVRGSAEDDSGIQAVWYKLTAENAAAPDVPTSATTDAASWAGWTKADGTTNWKITDLSIINSQSEDPEGIIKKLYVTAVDKNGVTHPQSVVIVKDFKVDLSNPTFTEASVKAGTQYKKADYTFSGTAKDKGSDIKSIVISDGTNTYNWYKNPTTQKPNTTGFTCTYDEDAEIWNYSYTVSVVSAEEKQYDYTLTATDGADKTTTLSRTVVYDKTKPEITPITPGSWYKTRTITITPTVTDKKTGSTEDGSGVDKVEASLVDSAHPDTDREWIDVPLSNGVYKGTVDFAADGKNQMIYLHAVDMAGNISDEQTVSVNIDTSDPDLDKLKYKVGDTSLKDISGTVYINATNGITIYGSYSDDLSGVNELTFAGAGYKTNVSNGNGGYKEPTVTYSIATSIPEGQTVEDLTYAAYEAANADKITYWKAVFTNDILDSGKLSVTGTNIAGGSKTINLFTIDKDTVPPTFKNEKIEPDTEEFSVYKTKEGSGDSEKTVYYLNHKKQKFNLSGLASDANTAVDQVYIKIYKIDANGNSATTPSITDNNATGYFSNIQFADLKDDGTVNSFWQYGAKIVITTTDIAGNSTYNEDPTKNTDTILNIKFDSESPTSKHEVDATGKDLVFRIGDYTNDDITSANASQYGLIWNNYTDTDSTEYSKIDETAGGKYSGGSFGNSYTQKVRGHFTDSGSGLKQVFYKIYDRTESKIFNSSTKEEKYDLTDAEKQALIEDVVSANQYFAPHSSPEYKRVFYNVKVGTQDTLGGKQLKKNSLPVIERKKQNEDGSWLTIKEETDPSYASATQFYKYWKLEETNYSFTIPQLNEGSNYLVIVAEDNVGNFYVDTSDPIDHDGNPSTPARKYSNFSMNVDTTPPVIELKDSTGEAYTTEVRYSDGGDYNIEVTVTDFGVEDTTEPTGYVPNTSSGIKKVELTTSEGTVKCSPKSGTTNIYTGNVKSILKNNKTLTVSATAYDVAGSSSTKVVANVMVDETVPTVTLTAPTDADKTTAGTQINGTITISGTASDPNGSGLKEAVALYYKVVTTAANAPAKPADNADTTANTWDWTAVTGVTPSGTSPWSFENVDTTAITDGSRVFFTASVKDNAGNVGYANPVEVFIDQDSDRPVIKITSMSLSGMASDNRAGSKEPELTGSVSDDDEVPNALAYRIGDTGDFTDSEATGSSLSYSASDGQFTLTLDDGPQNVYFKVTTNEKDENDEYVTFETKLNPATTDIQGMPKLTDRGGTKYGYKDSTTTTKTTVIYLAVDTEAPETEEFAFTRTPTDASSWTSAISGEYFGGSQRQKFYLREYAYDANEVKQVYLSLPADENDGSSTAITAWTYKNEQTRVTKTIYTKGNQPAVNADYWLISTATDTKDGSLSAVAANHNTVTISSGDNAGTYTRSAYIFQLEGPGEEKTGKIDYFLWQSAYDEDPDDDILEEDNPVDVTNLASGERNATLVTFDGTRQTTESKTIRIDNTPPEFEIDAPTAVSNTAIVKGNITNEAENVTVEYAVTRKTVTDHSAISDSAWQPENKARLSYRIVFDGDTSETETHTDLFRTYLTERYLGITSADAINGVNGAAPTYTDLTDVNVWIHVTDSCGNEDWKYETISVDPQGTRPTVKVSYPANGVTLGGSVTIMGTAQDDEAPKFAWLQFDFDGTAGWGEGDYNLLKDKYTFGDMATNGDVTTSTSLANKAIKVPVNGGAWNFDLESTDLFPNEDDTTNTVTMSVYATDEGFNKSVEVKRTFTVDKNYPYFDQTSLKLVQYTDDDPSKAKLKEQPYVEGMSIRGIWWLEGKAKDDSGIQKITVSANDAAAVTKIDVKAQTPITEVTDGDYRFTKVDESEREFEDENGNTTTVTTSNYQFKIKVGGDGRGAGKDKLKIKIWEYKLVNALDSDKDFIINYDNEAPTLAEPEDSSSGIATTVKNSNGFYGLHSTAYETKTGDTGIDKVAVYFTRNYNGKNYIFDPIYKKTATASKMEITTSTFTKSADDKLYWGEATISAVDKTNVTLSAAPASYVHIGGLAKVNGVVYRISGVDTANKKVTLSVSGSVVAPADNKIYFAVANVVDNTLQEKKPASPTILQTDYGYGYASFEKDDDDKVMEYLQLIDTTTWNWELYINSKNIPDGSIQIHYVVFDKAGNTSIEKVIDASVENNKPHLVSVQIALDSQQDGTVGNQAGETENYYPLEMTEKATMYKALGEANEISVPAIVVKSEMWVTPEIVGGNGAINYKIKKKGDTAYPTGNGTFWANSADDTNAANWTDANDYASSGALITRAAKITHDKAWYDSNIGANDPSYSLEYMLFDSKEDTTKNTVYIKIPNINFEFYDTEAPEVEIEDFDWQKDANGVITSNVIYENGKPQGHIELHGDLEFTDSEFSSSGSNELDLDDKVSGKIKIEGTASDNRRLSALYLSITDMGTHFGTGTGNASLTTKTVGTGANAVTYYQLATYDKSTGWTVNNNDGNNKLKGGSLANYGYTFEVSGNSFEGNRHSVNWTLEWDSAMISSVAAADVKIQILAEDAASEVSTDNKNKETSELRQLDVVPYITGISTELSKGNKNHPTVLSRSARGLYPVRRGSDITIEGFNFNGTTTGIAINGITIAAGKKTAVTVEDTEVVDTSKLTVTLDNDNLTSGGVVATVAGISSLNNKTSKTVGYNSEANGLNNDKLTDKRELHFVDVYTTTDPSDKRMLDMAINGDTINFSAGYKDSFFSTMLGASGTSIGTVNNLRNSYTRYFDNAIAMNDDGTPFTVSACGDTLGTPVTGWNNGPSHFALTRGSINVASGSLTEYYKNSNTNVLYLDSNWNGSSLNNLDRFKLPDIVVKGSDDSTEGYISYYDTTQNLIKFRYFTSDGTSVSDNLASYREGNTNAGITEGAVNTNTTYSQGYIAIAGANENSSYSAVGVTGNTALVAWYDTTNGSLKMKYNENPAGSFSGYQVFNESPSQGTISFDISVDGRVAKSVSVPYTYIVTGNGARTNTRNIHELAYQMNLVLSNGYGAYAEVDPKWNKIVVRSMQTGENSSISITELNSTGTNNGSIYTGTTTFTANNTNYRGQLIGAGTAWGERTIDKDTSGQYVAMKTDKKGGIHFAYYDTANGDLKYAYLSSVTANPVITTVDSYQQVGQYIDIALKENADGSQVTPYISYYSMSNADTTRAAKVAKLASPIVYTGTTPDTTVITNGVDSAEKFTGAWEAFHVPTNGKPVQYRVNIGVKTNGEVYISYLADRIIEYVKVDE